MLSRSGGGFLYKSPGTDLGSGGTITGNLVVTGTIGTGAATLASAVITGAATVGTTLGVTGVASFADGAVGAPGIAFGSDPTNGIYLAAADTPAIAAGGVQAFKSTATVTTLPLGATISAGKQLLLPDGTAGAPSLSWSSETNSGFYYSGSAQQWGKGGATKLSLETAGVYNTSVVTTGNNVYFDVGNIRINSLAAQAVNYQVLTSDKIVIMSGTTLTATLPAAPTADLIVWIKNNDAGTCTVARNGQTIDGAAADITLLAKEACLLHFVSGIGWYILSRGL